MQRLQLQFYLEIDPEVDYDSRRAVYFRQMRYGLFVRFFDIVICAPLSYVFSRFAWLCLPALWLKKFEGNLGPRFYHYVLYSIKLLHLFRDQKERHSNMIYLL